LKLPVLIFTTVWAHWHTLEASDENSVGQRLYYVSCVFKFLESRPYLINTLLKYTLLLLDSQSP
jgi:hypothetical protein